MDSAETRALVRLAIGRFQSFSEAAESVLNALEDTLPGTVMLGQFDPEEENCRVIDVRGPEIGGLKRGSTLPLASDEARDANGSGTGPESPDGTADGGLDRSYLQTLSIESWLAIPLEMSDGHIVGTLCALADRNGVYRSDHVALLAMGARLLSYEWESVQSRTEVRRLREQLRDDQSTDPETGLPNRKSFEAVLDREWRLVKRGTVQSVVIACRVEAEAPRDRIGEAMTSLAIKDAAAVLAGNARITDHVGRIADTNLAAVLVGCNGTDNAQAFLRRFQSALHRTTRGRPFPIAVSFGVKELAEADSPEEALVHAEDASAARSQDAPAEPAEPQPEVSA